MQLVQYNASHPGVRNTGFDIHGALVTENVDCWFQQEYQVLSGGLNEFDPRLVADALLINSKLAWEWQHLSADPFHGTFFIGNHFVFLMRSAFKMGKPGHLKSYTAGAYELDLKSLRPRRNPLSDRLNALGYLGELVGLDTR